MHFPKFANISTLAMPHFVQRFPSISHLRRRSQSQPSTQQTATEASNTNSTTSSPQRISPPTSNVRAPCPDSMSADMLRLHRLTVALGEDFVIPSHLLSSDEDLSGPLGTPSTHLPATPETGYDPAPPSPPRDNPWRVQSGHQIFSAASQALRDLCTSTFDNSTASQVDAEDVLLRNGLVNENGARSSEDIARDREVLFDDTPTRVTFSQETIFQRGPRQAPVRPPTPPIARPPTPPNTSRTTAVRIDVAENWRVRGTRAVISTWVEDLMQFRDDFKAGLQVYFTRWLEWFFFRGARKLIKATVDVAKILEKLSQDLATLPDDVAEDLSELNDQLVLCLREARRVYSLMTRDGVSATTPLTGRELAWRKYSIKRDLGPIMEHVARNLTRAKQATKEIRRKLQEEAESVMPEVIAGVQLIP